MKKQTLRSGLMATTTICGAVLSTMAGLAVVAGVAALPTEALAQDYTSGDFTGSVADASGAPVAGAAVTMVSPQGATYNATTNENGEFFVRGLPVGSYAVTIAKDGFDTATSTVSVVPVASSYAFSLTQAGAQGSSTVVIRGKRKNDFAKNNIGSSVNVQELSSRVPVGRSINAITLLTPGASAPDATINASSRRNQSLVSLAGTSAAESSYYINGIQVTDQRTFLGYADLPFDFIDQIDTMTGGYQAEFGRGTGGVVNIVTRSGTNTWTGGVSLNWQPQSLRSKYDETTYIQGGNNIAGTTARQKWTQGDSTAASFYIGGPIIKDHLFIFANYEARDVTSRGAATFNTTMNATTGVLTTATAGTVTDSSYDDPRWGMKLDWVINPEHRFEYTLFSDETSTFYQPHVYNSVTDSITGDSPSYISHAGGKNSALKYTGKFTDWFTLTALIGRTENAYLDEGDAVNSPGVLNLDNNTYDNARRFGLYNLRGTDVRDTTRISGDFYFSLLGDHHVKVGYDQEKLNSDAYNAYNGGAIYYYYGTGGSNAEIEKITFANNGQFQADQTAIYVQDAWKISPTLSLTLGLRNDIYDYRNAKGQSYVKIENQIAPRLGFSWDPTGEGIHRVYGSVGDYYLPIATNTSIRASSGEVYTDEYFTGTIGSDGKIVKDANGTPVTGTLISRTYYSPPGGPDPRAVIEKDLKPMYEREFILGYEHTFTDGLLADWRGGVRYIDRQLQSTIEDTAIGDAIDRYCTRTGCTPGPVSVYPYVLLNPGDEATVFIDLDGDAAALGDGSANPAYNPQWLNLTTADLNLQEAKREYKALEFTFSRPFDGKWGLAGSYTLARSYGNYEGAIKSDIGQTDTSITQDFDHAANQLQSTGFLPNNHTHTFKIYGNYSVNDRFSVGANFIAQSGRKYGCVGVVPTSVDPYAPQTGTPSGWYCPGNQLNTATASQVDYLKVATPRGSKGETPTTYQLDLNLSYKVLERGSQSVVAGVDIFNLLDSHEVLRVVEQGEIRSGTKGLKAPFYGQPRTLQGPRSVRVSLRYKF